MATARSRAEAEDGLAGQGARAAA